MILVEIVTGISKWLTEGRGEGGQEISPTFLRSIVQKIAQQPLNQTTSSSNYRVTKYDFTSGNRFILNAVNKIQGSVPQPQEDRRCITQPRVRIFDHSLYITEIQLKAPKEHEKTVPFLLSHPVIHCMAFALTAVMSVDMVRSLKLPNCLRNCP